MSAPLSAAWPHRPAFRGALASGVLALAGVSSSAPVSPAPVAAVEACLSFEAEGVELSARGEAALGRFLSVTEELPGTPSKLVVSLDPKLAAPWRRQPLGGTEIEQALDVVQQRAAAVLARLRRERPSWAMVDTEMRVQPNPDYSVSRCHVALHVLQPAQQAPGLCPQTEASSCRVSCDAFACERRAR